ncbi:MFS general substrate transporter [Polychaeton citri CBS 116435]|uniref:MFS general substrate transporter n=1 Tax=Polychaeton citri CBS 116435 TaxID=1314669 RepID=A0A9P4UNS2_9PEZI|nr:MFS general substrate transporter [Polychaeton citri CBS 116435]
MKVNQRDVETAHRTAAAEESEEARIERLGRERPEQLKSAWQEFGFVFSVIVTQLITEFFVSGFAVLVPQLKEGLDIPQASITWPASAFSLVISSFLLPFGRLGDIYGGYPLFIAGCAWYTAWTLIAGFAQNELMMDFCRALQGLGPAAYLPAGVQLIGSMYRPGPRKNIVFSLYGAMAPLGFFVGIFFGGVAVQWATWRWYFWIGTIVSAITTVVAIFCIPSDIQEHKGNGVKMDWWGALTIVCGIILVIFAITDCAHAPNGWKSPYIPITFSLGAVFLLAAIYVEGWVAEQPLLPPDVIAIKYMKPMIAGLLFAYGTLGIYLIYATLYIQEVIGIGPIQLVAWYVPMGLGGCILAAGGGFILHLIPGTFLAVITCLAIIADALLFALAPAHPYYWAWIFPAMVCATIAIDLIFNVATIFLSTSMPLSRQGLAGGLSNVLTQLSIALLLGFADIVATKTEDQGVKRSYKNAFWFELACGATALVIFVFFVRIDRAKSDLTADEKAALIVSGSAQVAGPK